MSKKNHLESKSNHTLDLSIIINSKYKNKDIELTEILRFKDECNIQKNRAKIELEKISSNYNIPIENPVWLEIYNKQIEIQKKIIMSSWAIPKEIEEAKLKLPNFETYHLDIVQIPIIELSVLSTTSVVPKSSESMKIITFRKNYKTKNWNYVSHNF